MRTNPLDCLHYIMLSSKMLCKNGNSISAIQRVWDYPKIQKTERFGGQPERSVFPVWVLTGFACYDISRAKNAILAPTKRTGARSLKFDCVLRFLPLGLAFTKYF